MPMQMRLWKRALLGSTLALGFSVAGWQTIEACTRVVYIGTDGIVITGRSMDWVEDMSSNLWAFPRGIKRDGAAGPRSLSWVAKYGSVVVSGYEAGTTDGMNEAGLVPIMANRIRRGPPYRSVRGRSMRSTISRPSRRPLTRWRRKRSSSSHRNCPTAIRPSCICRYRIPAATRRSLNTLRAS
jgi:Linear amide C-N hydrolases, choloylglycine hydrolase family